MRCHEDTLRFWPRLWPPAADSNPISLRDLKSCHISLLGAKAQDPCFLVNSIPTSCCRAVEEFSRIRMLLCRGNKADPKSTDSKVKVLHGGSIWSCWQTCSGLINTLVLHCFSPCSFPVHLALIKIPSVLLMRKFSSCAAVRANAFGSSCARPAVDEPTWKNCSQTSLLRQRQPNKRSPCQMCLLQALLSTWKFKSQSSHRGMHQNKSRTRYILW